jgi:hypothetical protein
MEQKQMVRIAEIRGNIIRKRCRKIEFKSVSGIGVTSEEAVQDLKNNFKKEKENWKKANFSLTATLFDGIRRIYPSHTSLERPVYPGLSDNVEYIDFVA